MFALLLAATTAHAGTIDDAFPPTVRVGTPAGGKLESIDIERGELAWITLRISARRVGGNVVVPLDLPSGAHVIGIQLARGDKVVWGQAHARGIAATRYEHAVAPTLLAWTGTSGDVDHLELRVDCASIVDGNSAITLAVELPATPNLHVEPAKLARVDGEPVRGPIAIAGADTAVAAPHVDADTSIVAEADGAIELGGAMSSPPEGWRDAGMIHRAMKQRIPALTHCYERVAQAHPELAGSVQIQMVVEPDGHVSSTEVGGTLASDEVKACFATVASTIEFPPARDSRTVINWPIELRLNR
jgi:hypothetical protein